MQSSYHTYTHSEREEKNIVMGTDNNVYTDAALESPRSMANEHATHGREGVDHETSEVHSALKTGALSIREALCEFSDDGQAPTPLPAGGMVNSVECTPESDSLIPEAHQELGTSPMRFVVIALFAAFGFINQVQYVAFSMIIRETQEYYNVGALAVNLLILLIPLFYVLGVFPGCWLYNQFGLRKGIIAGASINALGATLKLISVWVPHYAFLFIAQVCVAGGQILFLGLPTRIAGTWFPNGERTLATAVGSLMGFAGMAVGMFYSPRIVNLPDHNNTARWGALLGSQFAFSIIVLVLIVAFVPERPKLRPSLTASGDGEQSLWAQVKLQLRNRNVMMLTLSFGLTTGTLTAVAGVLTQILEPFGVSETIVGVLAFSGILGGAFNCAVVGALVDYTHRYKLSILFLIATVLVLLVPVTILAAVDKGGTIIPGVAYGIVPLLEFFALPTVPVAMELSVELTYPTSETVSTTLVLFSLCLFSFIALIVFSIILGDNPTALNSFTVMIIALIVCLASFILMMFVEEDLKRRGSVPNMVANGSETLNEPLCSETTP